MSRKSREFRQHQQMMEKLASKVKKEHGNDSPQMRAAMRERMVAAVVPSIVPEAMPMFHKEFHWLRQHLPNQVPQGWAVAEAGDDGCKLLASSGLVAVVSGNVEQDKRRWIHLSVSAPGRTPTWEELVSVKEMLLGKHSLAIQVIPPRSRYITIHPDVLHLFMCADGAPIPDFAWGGMTI
jgi:hypothetical protein